MEMISPSLRIEVIKHIFQNVLMRNEIFQKDKSLIKFVTDRLETQLYLPDKFVVTQGSESDGLYFISSGIVEILVKNEFGKEVKVPNDLESGKYFGEIAVINECKRTATATSKSYTTIARLNLDGVQDMLKQFPDVLDKFKEKMIEYEDVYRNYQIKMLRKTTIFSELDLRVLQILVNFME